MCWLDALFSLKQTEAVFSHPWYLVIQGIAIGLMDLSAPPNTVKNMAAVVLAMWGARASAAIGVELIRPKNMYYGFIGIWQVDASDYDFCHMWLSWIYASARNFKILSQMHV